MIDNVLSKKGAWRYVDISKTKEALTQPVREHENTNAHAQESGGPWQLSLPVNFYLDFFVFVGNAVGYTTISILQVTTCTYP